MCNKVKRKKNHSFIIIYKMSNSTWVYDKKFSYLILVFLTFEECRRPNTFVGCTTSSSLSELTCITREILRGLEEMEGKVQHRCVSERSGN